MRASPVVVILVLGTLLIAGCRLGGDGARPDAPSTGQGRGVQAGSVPGPADDELLAIVGGRMITAGELRGRILDRFYGMSALQGLIKEELFQREAARLSVVITDVEVQQRIEEEIDDMLTRLGHDRSQLEAALAEQGTTLQEHRRTLAHELRNLLLVERVVLAHRRRTGVTEKAIRDYHTRTFARTRLLVRHIAFPIEETEITGAAASPTAAAAGERSRLRAQQAQDRLLKGEDFGKLARTLSGDPVSADRDGRLGWIDAKSLRDDRLTAAIFALPVGVVSAPVLQDGYGYHVFLVEERSEAQPLEAARARIEEQLLTSPPNQTEIRSVERTLRAQTPVTVLPAASGASPALPPGGTTP